MGSRSFSLIFFFLIVIAVVLGLALAVVILLQRRKRVSAPSCGACGYSVAGLEVLRCPECGVDLRTAGIVTPAMTGVSRRTIAIVLVVLWTILLPFPATFVSALLGATVFRTWSNTLEVQIVPTQARPFGEIAITFEGVKVDGPATFEEATITGVRSGVESAALTVRLDTTACVLPAAGGLAREERSFDGAAVRAWMERLDMVGGDEDRAWGEANRIAVLVKTLPQQQAFQSDPFFGGGSISTRTSQYVPRWFAPTAAAFWLVAWGAVVLLIVRWARREGTTAAGP